MKMNCPDSVIVDHVQDAVGHVPVILCGSRAIGEAGQDSDWDIFVVMPLYKLALRMRRLARATERLESSLQAPVSVNPLPAFRLRRPGRTLLEWKLREEAILLHGPSGFQLTRAAPPSLTDFQATSYALSGLRSLLADMCPSDLAKPILSSPQARGVRKGLLHAVQLRLLARNSYAPRLGDAINLLGMDTPLSEAASRLAGSPQLPQSWFAVRDLLMRDIHLLGSSKGRIVVSNLQYATLSVLTRGGRPFWVLAYRKDIALALAQAVVALASALLPHGDVDESRIHEAHCALPPAIRPKGAEDWVNLRVAIEREWPCAMPLVGL
jgi:predicted nucleotidyltransferase